MNQGIEQFDEWLRLIRSEYGEMPGLRLSKPQAQRLWRLDAGSCNVLFDTLEATRFLRRTPANTYVRGDINY